MKILYYDCFSGISGDMHLGAMIDLGVDPDHLITELKSLNLEGYKIKISKDQRKGISGTRVDVVLEPHSHSHSHSNSDSSSGHHHSHHRNLDDIISDFFVWKCIFPVYFHSTLIRKAHQKLL